MAEQGFILRANPTDAMKLYRGSDEVSTGRGASSSRGRECDEDKRKREQESLYSPGRDYFDEGSDFGGETGAAEGPGRREKKRRGDAEAARCERVNTRRKHKYRLSLGQATS
jgi:hypothetical protein